MFINAIIKELAPVQKKYSGKHTIEELRKMPLETIEERFALLLESCSLAASLNIVSVKDGKSLADKRKIVLALCQAVSMSHNAAVVGNAIKLVMQELSWEIQEKTNGNGDFANILPIFMGEKEASTFLEVDAKVTIYNKLVSYVGKSGKSYSGLGITAISKWNTEEFIDVLSAMKCEGDEEIVRDYVLNNAKEMKETFKSHRAAMLAFMTWHIDPVENDSKIVKYILPKFKKPEIVAEPKIEEPKGEEIISGAVGAPLATDALDNK